MKGSGPRAVAATRTPSGSLPSVARYPRGALRMAIRAPGGIPSFSTSERCEYPAGMVQTYQCRADATLDAARFPPSSRRVRDTTIGGPMKTWLSVLAAAAMIVACDGATAPFSFKSTVDDSQVPAPLREAYR